MAQPMSSPVPSSALPAALTRSNSTSSNTSTSSGAALRRRSRTQTRTLARDATVARRGKSQGPPADRARRDSLGADDRSNAVVSQPDIPPPLPTRLPGSSRKSTSRPAIDTQALPVPQRRERAWSTVHIRDVPREARRDSKQVRSDNGSGPKSKARARGMSLPRSAFRPATASSDESSIASPRTPTGPSESPFVRVRQGPSHSQHFRDSIVSSSTSLYPKSTSSDSDFESSFPRSPKKRGRDFGPDAIGQADFDVDDVSYRLRLLVHNSYFLPPAHSKPSPLSLAPPKLPADHKRTSTSGFLDFFRKAKSKPTTPLCLSPPAVDDLQGPILRTTSDSTTASGHVPRLQSHSTPVTPLNKPATQPSASRVVVLREQMDDLLEAARQAERDLKTKGDGRKAKSQETTHERDLFDDVVDPTDIVDLPPPPASYPFPVQTSALHGLGPGESLGADFLADRLPPSPGIWSMSSEESSWRRAILQEAVSLSLSPKTSLISMSPKSQEMQSPTSGSFRSDTSDKPAETESTPTTRVLPLIGQRIIEPSIVGADKDETRTLSPLSALQGLQSTSPLLRGVAASPELLSSAWKGPQLPGRAETPAAMLPLTPPPFRKHLSHPQISAVVEAAKAGSPEPDAGRDSLSVIRKVVSSPGLGSLHERHKAAFAAGAPGESIESRLDRLGMFSPTFREDKSEGEPSQHTRPSTSMRETPFTDDDDLSYVTPGDIDDGAPRPSMTLSIPTVGRPSMDDSDDNPSPTASAFQDAVFGSYRAPSPLLFRRSYIGAIGAQPSSPSRANVTSPPPPPRTSSSVDATNLPPPPRAPGPKPIFTRPSTSSGRSTHSSLPMHSAVEEPEPESEVDPEFSPSTITSQPYSPTSPRSLSARRGRQSGLSLLIPTDFATPAIHSAPAPASPTAFFDRIQSHPNAMDDLETSEESDTESLVTAGEADAPVQAPPPLPKQLESFIPKPASARTSIASSRSSRSARPSFMRLGNHSSPHLTPGAARDDAASVLSFDVPDRRVPIGYIAPRDAPASRWKKGKGAAPPPLPRREDEPAPGPSRIPRLASTRRPATAGGGAPGPAPRQRASIQRFDSLLQEHIASERDTLKRITTNISNASRRP